MWCLNKLEFVTNGHVLLVQGLQRNIFWTCSCFDYVYENLTEPEAVDPKNNCLSCFNHVLSFLSIMFVYHYFIIIVTMFYNTKLHCKDTKCSDSMQCKARRTTVSQTKNPTLMFFQIVIITALFTTGFSKFLQWFSPTKLIIPSSH